METTRKATHHNCGTSEGDLRVGGRITLELILKYFVRE
jgi:hypothetical protein